MNPIISVVIPVYNGEKYVARAVESILNQPQSDWVEILIINDGSTDSSGAICDELSSNHENVTVIHKENGGVSSARNLGIKNVKTKYVAFLDCDDWWEPSFFDMAILHEFAKGDSADVYQFAYQEMDNYCSLKKVFPVKNEEYTYREPGLSRYDWGHHCSFVLRTALLRENGIQYPVSKVGEDGPFIEMALFCAGSLRKINRVIFTYWKNGKSCVHTTRRIEAIKEEYKAALQEKAFLSARGYLFDADVSLVWSIANGFPKLAATCSYHELRSFMENYCVNILAERPDIRFRKELWDRLESFRKTPRLCWLKYQIIPGILLRIQGVLYEIPGVNRITDYLYSRYVRGYVPVR